MKLDKIGFARVVGFIQRQFAISMSDNELDMLDSMIDIDAPEVPVAYPSTNDVNQLMALMAGGGDVGSKIDAIKLHRKLTGYGLKESKEEVEKHWGNSPEAKLLARVRQALGTIADGDDLVQLAKNAYRNSEELASQHNASKEPATLGDILGKVNTKERPPVKFDKFEG